MVRLVPTTLLRRLRAPGPGTACAVAWLLLIAGLEVLGRRSPSDLGDAIGVCMLALGAMATWAWHSHARFALLEAAGAALRRRFGRLRRAAFRIGIDLRGAPALPRGVPPLVWAVLAASVGLGAVALLLHAQLPTRARALALWISPALTFAFTGVLWVVLGLGCFAGLARPTVLVAELVTNRRAGKGARGGDPDVRTVALACLGHLVLLALGARALPTWAPLAGVLGSLACALLAVLLIPGARPALLWQLKRGPDEAAAPVRSMDWAAHSVLVVLVPAGLFCALYAFACGDRLLGGGEPATAFTAFLGAAFGWCNVATYALLAGDLVRGRGVAWLRDPARAVPLAVGVLGEEGAVARACGILERGGMNPSPEALPGGVNVRVDPQAGLPGFDATWPLVFAPHALARTDVTLRLQRRGEILSRRAALKGVERLFKLAAQRRYEPGGGWWFAPHLAYLERMTRDQDERVIDGVPYHPRLGMAARRHLYTVLRGADVDLLFLEDGVGVRRFKRVLLLLFEFHDLFGGERPAEERHFSGVPGVRVLIHDIDLALERLPGRYPEPDYESFGRARILHVFRDRGEDASRSIPPYHLDQLPGPLAPVHPFA